MVRIESAWIRQDPDTGRSNSLLLSPDPCMRSLESSAICSNSNNREPRRLELSNLPLERNSSCSIFLIAQLGGSCSGAAHNRGDSITACDQLIPLTRMQETIGEASRIQGRPETVAGFCKMKPRGSRIEAWIDSAE